MFCFSRSIDKWRPPRLSCIRDWNRWIYQPKNPLRYNSTHTHTHQHTPYLLPPTSTLVYTHTHTHTHTETHTETHTHTLTHTHTHTHTHTLPVLYHNYTYLTVYYQVSRGTSARDNREARKKKRALEVFTKVYDSKWEGPVLAPPTLYPPCKLFQKTCTFPNLKVFDV